MEPEPTVYRLLVRAGLDRSGMQAGPDGKFEHHLEEGYDEEDAETVHGGIQGYGCCLAGGARS
jgi:hypothetical protein